MNIISWLLFRFWVVKRGMTLGVRAVVLDSADRVLLIRHSYTPGWHFPGGGVEPGETMQLSLERELDEETGYGLAGAPVLHGIFHNRRGFVRDHVAVYVVRHFRQLRPFVANREIVECGFFALDALPEGTTEGTRQRLAEITGGAVLSPVWS